MMIGANGRSHQIVRTLFVALMLLQAPAPRGSIGGVVMKAGTVVEQPLLNARLELNGGPEPQIVRTDSGGRFVFSNLPFGRYKLLVTKDGFIRQEQIVISRGQPIRDLVFRLNPAPTVAGLVRDEAGIPIANVLIQALRKTYDIRGKPVLAVTASALTDDRGEYRIFWLDPGEYFLFAASDPQAKPIVPTYYPGVTEPEAARPLRAVTGREMEGIDFRLRVAALTNVFGGVSSPATGRPPVATITLTPPSDDPSRSLYRAQSDNRGDFALAELVVPGPYIVSGRNLSGEPLKGFMRINIPARPPGGVLPFYDIRLALGPGFAVNGRLVFESGSPMDLRRSQIGLVSVDSAMPSPKSVFPKANGELSMADVVPGTYMLTASGLPEDLYIKAARLGTTDVLADPMKIQKEPEVPLQILLGSDGGRITAVVYDRENRPFPEAQVVLVPDNARRDRPDQYRIATSGEDGSATIRGIPPGDYKLFAWESIEPNAYLNAEFLRSYEESGTAVRIMPGENAAAALRLIPKEQ